MDLSVAEFARRSGISRQRALAMVNAGQIEAKRVGRSWVINQRETARRAAHGRPLSRRMASIIISLIAGGSLDELNAQDRYLASRYLARLRDESEPASLLHSWMGSRQNKVIDVGANPVDLPEVARDKRVVPSGISDSRAGLSAQRELEGYISAQNVDSFVRDNLLVPSDSPNVRLHVVDDLPSRPAPLGLVLADLADWNRPREDGRVRELLRSVTWSE